MTQQTQQPDIDVTLTLKLSAVQTIAAALDEIPGKFGRPIFDEISRQVAPQVQAAQQPAPVTPTDAPIAQ
jgi:hypothetical protein